MSEKSGIAADIFNCLHLQVEVNGSKVAAALAENSENEFLNGFSRKHLAQDLAEALMKICLILISAEALS
jgi:hypothetical protein